MGLKFFKRTLLLGLILTIFSLFSMTSRAEEAEKYVSIRLVPGKTALKGGETLTVGIDQKIQPGWHTYWLNPGDSGTPLRVQWSGVEGLKTAPVEWPIPKKLPIGPLMNFGYEDRVMLLQDITLPEDLAPGPQTITADIDLLVCHEICIPEKHQASFVINGNQDPAPEAIESARAKLPLDTGWDASIDEKDGELIVQIKTDTPSAFSRLGSLELYPEEWGLIDNPSKTTAQKDSASLTLRHKRGDRALSDVPVSRLVVVYNDKAGERKAVRVSALNGVAPAKTNLDFMGISQSILLAFLGGLILNLMPCVFPVLSMKALSLMQIKDKELKTARLHGLAYTKGIILSFLAIGGLLILLKAGSSQVGWGFQLQHPSVILFLSYLFFILGLNLAGFFEINFGLSNAGQKLTQKSGLAGSFFTGVLATLVATPCTAPFMGVAMGYALTQPPLVTMAVFASLGLGLAFPYLMLTVFPAARHLLPKPGPWMETFRQFLAFPMFASSCWLIWVLSQQINHMGQFAALLGMLAIAFGIWLLKMKHDHRLGRLLAVILITASFGFALSTFFTLRPMEKAQTLDRQSENWEDFTRPGLEEYLKGNDPVFVNMTAAWCITCKMNEKIALSTKATQKLFADHKVKYLKGDWTNQNPEITSFLEEYGRSGVPIYVYYGPRDAGSGVRPQAVVLPQILTPGIVENAVNAKGN